MSQPGAQSLANGHAILSKYLLAGLFTLAPAGSDQAKKKRGSFLEQKDLIPVGRPRDTDWHGGFWHNTHLFGSFFRPERWFQGPSSKH